MVYSSFTSDLLLLKESDGVRKGYSNPLPYFRPKSAIFATLNSVLSKNLKPSLQPLQRPHSVKCSQLPRTHLIELTWDQHEQGSVKYQVIKPYSFQTKKASYFYLASLKVYSLICIIFFENCQNGLKNYGLTSYNKTQRLASE